MEGLVIEARYLGVARSDGEAFYQGKQAFCLRPTYRYRRLLSGMSELFVPAEFAAMVLALAAVVLGPLFAFPETFRLWSPGSRVACLRLLLGGILAMDATLQFLPGAPPQLAYLLVVVAGQNQPALSWWFSYWASVIAGDPGLWWYGTGVLMAFLATCLILGVARRLAYVVGFLFSVMLWAIPNGFGGPYAAPNTDIGAGLLYAVLFLILLQVESVSGPARLTADATLERRWPRWRVIGGASLRRRPPENTREEERGPPQPTSESPSAALLPATTVPSGSAAQVSHPGSDRRSTPRSSGKSCMWSGTRRNPGPRPNRYPARRMRCGSRRGMDGICRAFEVFVLLAMGITVSLALAVAVGRRLRAVFSPSVRTTALRMFFGAIWMADGLLRFFPGTYSQLSYWLVVMIEDGQPRWLMGWFSAWASLISGNPAFWWYGFGLLELAIGFCLFTGFVRRPVYLFGLALSIFLWTVPQGFGGPYGPGSTDMGTGILYATIFLALLHLDSVSGPPRFTLDTALGRRWPTWQRLVQARAPTQPAAVPRESGVSLGRSADRTSRIERGPASGRDTRTSPGSRS